MTVRFNKRFIKQYKKLRALQRKVDKRLVLFKDNPFHPTLNNHALSGKYQGRHSINITGDYRAIYTLVANDTAMFVELNTHSNLYK